MEYTCGRVCSWSLNRSNLSGQIGASDHPQLRLKSIETQPWSIKAGPRLFVFGPAKPDRLQVLNVMNYEITALKLQKRNRQRVNVYLDGEFAFGLARIVAAWLAVGQEIDDQKIAQLQQEDAREVAYQRALKFLTIARARH